ncbi:hypothetical protein RN001_001880 [Aquatica leii]|uniref:Ig-like domain-containing protein n=1 Tax=Aquatica leii TaxID=1421715 RepID=A0AAN7PGE9_9COLE|nr:hypothetical protein RN001_001880 [Aquatica leii]
MDLSLNASDNEFLDYGKHLIVAKDDSQYNIENNTTFIHKAVISTITTVQNTQFTEIMDMFIVTSTKEDETNVNHNISNHLLWQRTPERSESAESSTCRYKRSYDVRHRSKENVAENALKNTQNSRLGIFATDNSTIVVAQIGGTATLPCVVRKFNTGVISWIRKDDHKLLTVGLTTYSSDGRFLVEHVRHLQNWGLLIKHVQPSDAGIYECQISTYPPTSIFVILKVTEAVAEILGAPDLHIRAGSTLRLVCSLKHSTEPPSYVFWYHERHMINYDAGVMVLPDRSSSVLLLHDTDKSHNGNYTCSPSNAVPASINVHVLNSTAEEKPAAMQHANTSTSSSTYLVLNFSVPISLTILILQSSWER